ncbi:AAA family ATPase [Klebsiella aerogenes]
MGEIKAEFRIIDRKTYINSEARNVIYLRKDSWNDYSYRTLFNMEVKDANAVLHKIGGVKIGFFGQTTDIASYEEINSSNFTKLDDRFFALGDSLEFYQNIMDLPDELSSWILTNINDVVKNNGLIDKVLNEDVFKTSLLRSININTLKGQFTRLVNHDVLLTKYDFDYIRKDHSSFNDLKLKFKVIPFSTPPTNIHTIIGRNGVGKTTLLNDMVSDVILEKLDSPSHFYDNEQFDEIDKSYFSAVISVSFSAFDPFIPMRDQEDPTKGTCYYYIGLKKVSSLANGFSLRTDQELREMCASSLEECFLDQGRKDLWISAIKSIESDNNFAELNLTRLSLLKGKKLKNECINLMRHMSSGHAIVFLTLTKLIEKTQEKTLVLFDEPESHLHPPLLSALIRAVSNLLVKRNGIAIIATHSPVVIQEVPSSCTWILTRYGNEMSPSRPEKETFGENVGLLTRDVFRLEVERSGYHKLLKDSVDDGKSFEQIMSEYKFQIGAEGQALLRSLILVREMGHHNKNNSDDEE